MAKALPIIDLSSWSGGGAAAAEVAKAIGAACRDVGFFYVAGHGVPITLMDEAFAQSRRFFALPLAAKEAIAIEAVGGNRGYSALLHEALDPTRGPDLKEAFNVGFELQPDDPVFSPASRSVRSTPGRISPASAKRCLPITTPAPRLAPACIGPSPVTSAWSPTKAEVAAIPSCVARGEAARYPPILAADYLKLRLDASQPAGP